MRQNLLLLFELGPKTGKPQRQPQGGQEGIIWNPQASVERREAPWQPGGGSSVRGWEIML